MRRRSRQSGGPGKLRDYGAETAIILGSGLSSVIELLHRKPLTMHEKAEEIPYRDFNEIPRPTVRGHAGRFVLGKINIGAGGSRSTKTGQPARVGEPAGEPINVRAIFAQGRVHLYEGYSAREVTAIVSVLAKAGIKQLILTNAAGALNPKFKPGDWMMITDHINLTGTSPLIGNAVESAVLSGFLDMTDAFSPRLREKFRAAAHKIDIVLHEGVYAGVLGPQYETPAEVRMLQKLGADAIGMSTVLEVIQARAFGLEVAAFSCLTNVAAGLSKEKFTHEQVLEVGKKAAADFARLLQAGLSM
jgi:purine-nucleoside phosphorylase